MYKTFQGTTENSLSQVYLRPETAQGIFINFMNVQRTQRAKLPFGIGQIGKSFRNEITPANFIFRTREFEQMEIEHFCFPHEADQKFMEYLESTETFLTKVIGLDIAKLKKKEHDQKELAHYSIRTVDWEFDFPHGWSELWGICNRSDYDLKSHALASKKNLWYLNSETNEKIIPYVIEPSVGVERLLYAVLCNAYNHESLKDDENRVVLKLPYDLCPYKVAFLPLTNKQRVTANNLYLSLLKQLNISMTYDDSGSIGKRYRRQDAIGTMFCITYDFDSENDLSVTIRNRDTMKQERILISKIAEFL